MRIWHGDAVVKPLCYEQNTTQVYLYITRLRSDGEVILVRSPMDEEYITAKYLPDNYDSKRFQSYIADKFQNLMEYLDSYLNDDCNCKWPPIDRGNACPVHGR